MEMGSLATEKSRGWRHCWGGCVSTLRKSKNDQQTITSWERGAGVSEPPLAVSGGTSPAQNTGLSILASGTLREKMSIVLSRPVCDTCSRQPQKTNTAPLFTSQWPRLWS